MTGSRHVRASQAGIFTTMLPISACVVGWLLGEQTNLIQWIALGLSLFAVVLVTKK
jgi:drug/metabolite transporter (DMT)-like permease